VFAGLSLRDFYEGCPREEKTLTFSTSEVGCISSVFSTTDKLLEKLYGFMLL